jgi:mRNA interferase MazF
LSRRTAPWQAWWVNFDPQVGREQAGLRPAIVVGTPLACGLPNGLTIVVPLTTRDRGLPFHPPVNLSGRPGFAMTDQVKAISTDRLVKRHTGTLTEQEIDSLKFALRQIISVT